MTGVRLVRRPLHKDDRPADPIAESIPVGRLCETPANSEDAIGTGQPAKKAGEPEVATITARSRDLGLDSEAMGDYPFAGKHRGSESCLP